MKVTMEMIWEFGFPFDFNLWFLIKIFLLRKKTINFFYHYLFIVLYKKNVFIIISNRFMLF